MNLQYINNTEPPPAESVLQYSISPDTVFVSTSTQPMYANLTVTVFNPSQTETVTCQMFKFGFYVGAQYGDLTTSATGIETSSDQSSWTISSKAKEDPDNPTLYQFSAPASGMANQQLAPQQSLVFHLNGILINEAVGEGGVPIAITEITGTRNNPSVVQGEITITKTEPTLSAQLSVVPSTPINPGQEVTLSWQLTDSDHWRLYDYGTSTVLYDSETSQPPNADSYGPVSPQQNTNYELLAFKGELFTPAYAEAMVIAPGITNVKSPEGAVDAGAQVVIGWTSVHATTVTLEPGGQTADATGGQGQFTVEPGGNTPYTLTPYNGTYEGRQWQVTIYVNPPQITSLTASTTLYPTGQPVSLSWETKSAASASLGQSIMGQEGIINLGSVEVQSAGHAVNPKGISTYILTAAVDDGRQAQAQVMVVENGGTFPVGDGPLAIVFDGTCIWVANLEDNTLSVLKASDGTPVHFAQGPTITVGVGPAALAFDGTYIWVANCGDTTVSVVKASDGTLTQIDTPYVGNEPMALAFDGTYIWVANQAGNNVTVRIASDGAVAPFPHNPIPVGKEPMALAFDGTHIWVANQGDNTVTVLKASDGTPVHFAQNPIPVGIYPSALVFDGTHIWVANQGLNNVSVLKASDGTPASFAQAPITVGNGPSALAFDGTYIWVANNRDNTVTVLKASDGTRAPFAQDPIPVGIYPSALVFDGTHIWVVNEADNTVLKL